MSGIDWQVFHHTAARIRAYLPRRAERKPTVDLEKVRAEAWGDALTEAEARQRIADQAARMHGAGGLF